MSNDLTTQGGMGSRIVILLKPTQTKSHGKTLRIISGALYHVTSRSDRREAIFEDDEGRLIFLRTLGRGCRAIQLTVPRLLPDEHPLPSAGGNTGWESL